MSPRSLTACGAEDGEPLIVGDPAPRTLPRFLLLPLLGALLGAIALLRVFLPQRPALRNHRTDRHVAAFAEPNCDSPEWLHPPEPTQACLGDCPSGGCCSDGSCCPSGGRCTPSGHCCPYVQHRPPPSWEPALPALSELPAEQQPKKPVMAGLLARAKPTSSPSAALQRLCQGIGSSAVCLQRTGCRWFSYAAPCAECEAWLERPAVTLTGCQAWDPFEFCQNYVYGPMLERSGGATSDPALVAAVQHFSFSLGSSTGRPHSDRWTCYVWCDPAGNGCFGQAKADMGLRGVNYGGRFVPEHFLGLYNSDNFFGPVQKPLASKDKSLCDMTAADSGSRMARFLDENIHQYHFARMAELGFNIVRLPLGYWNLIDLPEGTTPDGTPEQKARWRNLQSMMPAASYMKWIDMIFNYARSAGLKVMPDLHGVPGGQSGNECTGCDTGIDAMFYFLEPDGQRGKNMELAARAVAQMASICGARQDACYGIELLNEPYGANVDTLFMPDLAKDIQACSHHGVEQCNGMRLFFTEEQLKDPERLLQQFEDSKRGRAPAPVIKNTSRQALRAFYDETILAARAHLPPEMPVVIMDWAPWLAWWMENAHFTYAEHGNVMFSTHFYKFPEPWSTDLEVAKSSFNRDMLKLKDFMLNSGYSILVSEYALNSHGNGDGSDAFPYASLVSWFVSRFNQFAVGSMIWNFDSFWPAWGAVEKDRVGQSAIDWRSINS